LSHFLKNHIPWILWGLLIIALISIPGNDLPKVSGIPGPGFHFHPDKLVHVLLFLVFVFLLMKGFDHPPTNLNSPENLFFFALLAGIILSGGTEIFQFFFISGRNATLKDFLFNTLGCLMGWQVYSIWRNRIHHKLH
jgi:VanZ family protein